MRSVVAILIGCTGAALVAWGWHAAGRSRASGLESLEREIQGKAPEEVRAHMAARFGPPARDVGSGEHIPQWDVDGGVLTFHPLTGPAFVRAGVARRLMHTTNPAALCVFGNYEMTTLPDPANHGTRFWVGNMELTADGRYLYKDAGAGLPAGVDRGNDFFARFPKGTAAVAYAEGVAPETRLEDLPDGARVATVTLAADDGEARRSYALVADRDAMRLAFDGPGPMSFVLDKGWVNYWR